MEKNEKILLISVWFALIIIGFILGRVSNFKKEMPTIEDNSIRESTVTCNEKPVEFLNLGDRKIYVLKNNSVDSLISELEDSSHLNDGGTIIYKDGGSKKITDNRITVIKCNRLPDIIGEENNHDIYIGPDSMKFEENFCKNDME